MARLARWLLGILAALAALALLVSVVVSRPLFDERLAPASLDAVTIAPPELALSFARARIDDRLHVLSVQRYRDGRVEGTDLTAALGADATDPLRLYREHGYDGLQRIAAAAPPRAAPAATLDLPFDAPERNIGVGLNFGEHAAESGLDEPPFLFPKYALPTRHDSALSRGASKLLDYEAELGLVLLEDTASPDTAQLGFVLANEATDRWRLVRNFRRTAPMGTTGFADGKSREGFAPLGPLLVIPRDAEAFHREIELRLYLNGGLRQRDTAAAMRWAPRRILAEIFAQAATPYEYRGAQVSLLGAGPPLPAGTVIFAGTPAGVVFKPLNLWNPWVYLLPGDEVVVQATYLGTIRNRIVE